MERFTVQVPASTSNLGPGFDTLGLALNLYLKVSVKSRWDGRRKVTYAGLGAHFLKDESESLIAKAILETWKTLGVEGTGFELEVQNEIPLSAGLGSSAAAIASGIEIGCRLAKKRMPVQDKIQLGYLLEGHPDNIIPAFTGGFVIALTQGDHQVDWLRFTFPAKWKMAVVTPEFTVATRNSRDVMPSEVPIEDVVFNLQRLSGLVSVLTTGKWQNGWELMADRLHQPYRMHLVPGLSEILKIKPSKNLLGLSLSGSGPSVVALTRSKPEDIGQQIVREFSRAGYKSSVRILRCDNRGARFLTGKRK